MKKSTTLSALLLTFFLNSFAAADVPAATAKENGHLYFFGIFGLIIVAVLVLALRGRASKKKNDSPAPMRSMPKDYRPGGYA